ncbi:MAG: hypothetical protein RBT20_14130, partial [Syntrophales bacterium]|nr:hypothetical protein [Syntrophales bacterium]
MDNYFFPFSDLLEWFFFLTTEGHIDVGTKKLAVHERLYGNNKWCLNPDHYLDLIQQRPMAFNSARPI